MAQENSLEVWPWLQVSMALPASFMNPTDYVEFSASEPFLASVGQVSGDWLPNDPRAQAEGGRAASGCAWNVVFNVSASPHPLWGAPVAFGWWWPLLA